MDRPRETRAGKRPGIVASAKADMGVRAPRKAAAIDRVYRPFDATSPCGCGGAAGAVSQPFCERRQFAAAAAAVSVTEKSD
jgi:hypothetical protein